MADEDLSQMSGSALREKLEEALKQNRQLAERVTGYEAKDVLAAEGLDLVKPEDLKGVAPDQIKAKAQEIQTERKALQDDLLRKALERQGFKGDDIESMIGEAQAATQAASAQADAIVRARSLGTGGDPVPEVNPEKLHGYDAIRHAMENPKRRARAL